jgi:hypothetical protein
VKCGDCTPARCDCLERAKDRVEGMERRNQDMLRRGEVGVLQTELNEIRIALEYILRVIERR